MSWTVGQGREVYVLSETSRTTAPTQWSCKPNFISAEVKNEWNCTTVPSACFLVVKRGNCIFNSTFGRNKRTHKSLRTGTVVGGTWTEYLRSVNLKVYGFKVIYDDLWCDELWYFVMWRNVIFCDVCDILWCFFLFFVIFCDVCDSLWYSVMFVIFCDVCDILWYSVMFVIFCDILWCDVLLYSVMFCDASLCNFKNRLHSYNFLLIICQLDYTSFFWKCPSSCPWER
jgi:hypothetical protein